MAVLGGVGLVSAALAQIPKQSVIEKRLGAQWSKTQRDKWFDSQLRGRSVRWTGKVMSVQEQTYGGVVVEMLRASPPTSFECVITPGRRYFKRYALALKVGQQATCGGVISGYLRLYGVVRLRIEADALDRAAAQ